MVKSYNSINKNDFDGFLKFGSPKSLIKNLEDQSTLERKKFDYKFENS